MPTFLSELSGRIQRFFKDGEKVDLSLLHRELSGIAVIDTENEILDEIQRLSSLSISIRGDAVTYERLLESAKQRAHDLGVDESTIEHAARQGMISAAQLRF
jgi:hypothetical protein